MNNLDLHNKLEQLGKKLRELHEKHPDLSTELHPIDQLLHGETTALPSHPIGSPLYRKGD